MKRITLLSSILACSLFALDSDGIKNKLSSVLTNTPIESVTKSQEMAGLYEIHAGPNIIYTDDSAQYLMFGHIFDLNGTDLTQIKTKDKMEAYRAKYAEQMEQMQKEREDSFKKIEAAVNANVKLSKALKIGNGKHKVIVFTDPMCPFCRKAEEHLKGGDYTKYVFFNPLPISGHEKAGPEAIHILCSKNPQNEYEKAMRGELDSATLKECESGKKQLSEMKAYSDELGIQGAPLFVIDGKLINGADPKISAMVK